MGVKGVKLYDKSAYLLRWPVTHSRQWFSEFSQLPVTKEILGH